MDFVLNIALDVLKCIGVVLALAAATLGCVNIALFLGRKK